jgi:type III restriction enzyme
MTSDNPILNNPYFEPKLHYATQLDGALDYTRKIARRRLFVPEPTSIHKKASAQVQIFDRDEVSKDHEQHLINRLRIEVGTWRTEGYPHTTRMTLELLNFWFVDYPENSQMRKLFFAQQEAIETAIWLNEVAERSNAGNNILQKLKAGQAAFLEDKPDVVLPRIAFKMATGTGKTVVMAATILYHFYNRQDRPNDIRFADNFLLIAPGVTIRDRLNVLIPESGVVSTQNAKDYYRQRGLVPIHLEAKLGDLANRIAITNYHAFEPKVLQGNKKSPMDGKVNLEGKKIQTDNKEEFGAVLKRVFKGKAFKSNSRLLVLNDEAHHCYYPLSSGRTKDSDEDENERAAVWYRGLMEVTKRFKLQAIYDLSATPYYLQGSGYHAYSLFSWVVSDFSLTEAIESGLVKIPFLPESDNTQDLEGPKLKNLYEHVKDGLPDRKNEKIRKELAKKEGKKVEELPPQLPPTLVTAFDQFYRHYKKYEDDRSVYGERSKDLTDAPPVFIAVCNNTLTSREVYKYIAGFEETDDNGNTTVVHNGKFDLFSNYDYTKKRKRKPPTLLIDSAALEGSEQISDDFKKIFKTEIETFKKEYARMYGQGSADRITDSEILREIVNTVGKPSALGSHIRCVVSVSMLTEGWDANTVTHIAGLRAFGSLLLCEQVAGRALRRRHYDLQWYDKNGEPTNDGRKYHTAKFPPEYAYIIGIPFKVFKGGTKSPPVDPPQYVQVRAVPERQEAFEISFPQIESYRMEYGDDELKHDFSALENFEIDLSKLPIETKMGSAVSAIKENMASEIADELRDQEVIYQLTQWLLNEKFKDDDGNRKFHLFPALRLIVAEWYNTKIRIVGFKHDPKYRRLVSIYDKMTVCNEIAKGINAHRNNSAFVRPVFNHYRPFGSTSGVNGLTIKEVYPTDKSHVDYVVMDSDWEAIAAKTLDEMPEVISYVKNQFLGFAIPYQFGNRERLYFPDFIARVKNTEGGIKNLIIEITGMNKEKADKKWTVENRWLPAVNAVKDKYGYDEWEFIEIANDIRDIRPQLEAKILGVLEESAI